MSDSETSEARAAADEGDAPAAATKRESAGARPAMDRHARELRTTAAADGRDNADGADAEAAQFEEFLEYLALSRGFDFTAYKRSSLMRRVRKRMSAFGHARYDEYTDYLQVHPEEFVELFNTVLINVTSFFRDPPCWETIAKDVIPAIIGGKKAGEPIRVWSAGCASGEETYSLAMYLAEALGDTAFRQRVKIYGTDLDEDALATARQAMYSEKSLAAVPEALRAKYFEPVNGQHGFRKDLRRAVIFGRHDLLKDAPISRVDLLVCRNTLMYFNSEAQERVLARFLFALNAHGYVLLGKAETLLTHTSMLTPVDLKQRVFTKMPRESSRERTLIPPTAAASDGTPGGEADRLRHVAFEVDPTPQVSVDAQGFLVAANERARQLFGIHGDDIGRPLQDLELSYRPIELRSVIEQAYRDRRPVTIEDVEWSSAGITPRWFNIQFVPLWDDRAEVVGVNLVFSDVTESRRLQEELRKSKLELETAYEELQSSNEELETTNEELQSTVEELETTNEELQSTNEELETMNEELHSTNEELEAVNIQSSSRAVELVGVNSFLESILTSLHVGVVVVGPEMLVQAWNRSAEDLWGLRREEVEGTNFLALDSGLPVDELKSMVRECLAGVVDRQEQTVRATNRRGKPIVCRITCMPLRTAGNDEPGGVILLMDEITDSAESPRSESQ